MWNSDTYAYDSEHGSDLCFRAVLPGLRHGQAHGIFLDNTWRSNFDIGRERQDLLTFGAEGGELDYYFINGPDPEKSHRTVHRADRADAVAAAVVARLPSVPIQLLSRIEGALIADTFRQKEIPADVIWLDIHFQDNYKPFTWNHERFPDPKKMIADLRGAGFPRRVHRRRASEG